MKRFKIRLERDSEGDWWAQAEEALGLFICGTTREEVMENAKASLAMEMNIEEEEVELDVIETKLL